MQSLLKRVKADPPQEQLEEVQAALLTSHGLYQQEGDKEGAAIYQPLVQLAQQAKSIQDLQNSL
jgi:hypothetical protein